MELQRRWFFVFSLIGIFVLVFLLSFLGSHEVDGLNDLKELEENMKVSFESQVKWERKFGQGMKLGFENGVEGICSGCVFGNVGKSVSIVGIVDSFGFDHLEESGGKGVRIFKVVFK